MVLLHWQVLSEQLNATINMHFLRIRFGKRHIQLQKANMFRMKNLLYILIFFVLLINTGCGEKETERDKVYKVNPHEAEPVLLLSDLVDSVSYIKLETEAESMMVRVGEVIIKSRYIYAMDYGQMAMLVFDKRGEFVAKLAKAGDGPDEYRRLGPVFVSEDEEYVEIIDYMGENSRILRYANITFEVLAERKFSAPSANSCKRENENYYFAAQQIENVVNGEITNADIIVVNESGIQKPLFHKNITTNGNTFSYNTESFTQNKAGDIFVSLMYNNTFFRLSGMEAYPELTVDFGKYGIDNSIGQQNTAAQEEYLEKNAEGLAFMPVLNINEPNMVAFTYNFKENSKTKFHHYIHMKGTDKIFHANVIVNDISGFPRNVFICSFSYSVKHDPTYDGHLVHIVIPEYGIDSKGERETEVAGIGTVKIEDNPVIMLMRLKEEYRFQ